MHEANPDIPTSFVAFDTETTGLSPLTDHVLEIAAIRFGLDGSTRAVFERLVDPGVPIPPALTAIHGISDTMVRGQPCLETVLDEFIEFIGDAVLVAHNAPFDVAMLLVPLARMKDRSRGPGSRPRLSPAGNLVLDTCAMARRVHPGWPGYSLGVLARRLGILHERAHRALPDVEACRALFLRLLAEVAHPVTIPALIRLNGSELRFGRACFPPEAFAGRGADRDRLVSPGEAFRPAERVWIEYHGGSKGRHARPVTPITLLRQGRKTFLLALCHLDGCLKNFRLDRIRRVAPGPSPPAAWRSDEGSRR
ncbi:MAG: exonuclease domain-containing protein [Acidobacteriota bacterium]